MHETDLPTASESQPGTPELWEGKITVLRHLVYLWKFVPASLENKYIWLPWVVWSVYFRKVPLIPLYPIETEAQRDGHPHRPALRGQGSKSSCSDCRLTAKPSPCFLISTRCVSYLALGCPKNVMTPCCESDWALTGVHWNPFSERSGRTRKQASVTGKRTKRETGCILMKQISLTASESQPGTPELWEGKAGGKDDKAER
jgi:hypothetical protein